MQSGVKSLTVFSTKFYCLRCFLPSATRLMSSNWKPTKSSDDTDKTVNDKLANAAKKVSKSLKGNSNEMYSDIISQLKNLETKVKLKTEKIVSSKAVKLPKAEARKPVLSIGDVAQVISKEARKHSTHTDKEGIQNEMKFRGKKTSKDLIARTKTKTVTKDAMPYRRTSRMSNMDTVMDFFNEGGNQHITYQKNKTRDQQQTDSHKQGIGVGFLKGEGLLDSVKPIGIFNPAKWTSRKPAETVPVSSLWTEDKEEAVTNAKFFHSNGFDEMIQWTEEGKLWHYPINNEQGMEDEEKTPFYEHIFLDKHLEAFPATGPVREFMQLVILGLSNNPHLTVDEKVSHIQWFAEYFKSKQAIVPDTQLLNQQSQNDLDAMQ